MLKRLTSLIICALLLSPAFIFAKEPTNLAVFKHRLEQYHDSGEYLHDISDVIQNAMRYLELRVKRNDFHGKKPAIILDIDETSLSNYRDMISLDFGGTLDEMRLNADKGTDGTIMPTLKLYRYAKEHHIAVFFLTGREEGEREATEENLQKAGYLNYDGLILRDGDYKKAPASVYKTAIRNQLTDKGYDILVNIGDQQSDLHGGYADKTFKLPNPYYLIP